MTQQVLQMLEVTRKMFGRRVLFVDAIQFSGSPCHSGLNLKSEGRLNCGSQWSARNPIFEDRSMSFRF